MRFSHRCPVCSSLDTVRSPGLSRHEDVLAFLFLWRYRCRHCNWPFVENAFRLHRVRDDRRHHAAAGQPQPGE